MRKDPDYLSYVPVSSPVVTLLTFPPISHLPSGFYKVEPDGAGSNRYTLLEEVEFNGKHVRGWVVVENERANAIAARLADEESALCKEIRTGTPWRNLEPLISGQS